MKKELLISAKFDTADFDRSIESMQRKLKDLYAPADQVRAQSMTSSRLNQMGIGGMGMPGNDQYAREMQRSKRDLDAYIRDQAQGQEKLTKIISGRVEKLEKLKSQQKDLIKGSMEELAIKEKIARVEENNFRLKEQYQQRNAVINQALDARSKVAPRDIPGLIEAFKGGGARYGMSQVPGAFRQNPVGMWGGLAAGVGSAIGAGAELYGNYTQSPLRTAGNLAGGIRSTVGNDVQNIYGRRSAFESAFNPERSKAAQMALEANKGFGARTFGGIASNVLGYGAAGAAGGAAVGGIGAIPGAIGGAAYGAYKSFGDPTQRSAIMSGGGLIPGRYSQEFQSARMQEMGGNYEKGLQDLKSQNPGKTMASQYYEQNYQGNLASQRSMGMSNRGFYGMGGFLQSGMQSGFGPETMQGMSSGILSAGGSSRSAAGNSVFGNQLSRNMDMTNSSQILGSLSGGMGGAEASKQTTIKILAEGMKLGLDDSKFAEENRRFTQAAADIISRSGAQNAGDAGRIAGGFGSFVAENTNKGIESAQGAYQKYQEMSSTTSGPRGVMRAAGFMSDPVLSKLSTVEKQSLMGMKEEEINEGNLQAVAIADKLNISVDDLKDKVRGTNQGSISRYKQHDAARDRLKAKGIDISNIKSSKDFAALDNQTKEDIRTMSTIEGAENSFGSTREARSFMAGQLGGREQFGPGAGTEAVNARLGGLGGRQEDITNADAAKDFGIVLNNFRDFKKEIIPTADAIEKFTGKIREMMMVLSGAKDASERAATIKYYVNSKAENQQTAGKNSK